MNAPNVLPGLSSDRDMNGLDAKLLASADGGDCEAISKLISEGANPNCQDSHKNTPLSNAAWKGNIDALELLLEKGAYIDHSCYEDNCLLSHCAFNAQIGSVKWLLANGQNPNRVSEKTGETALHVVICKKGDPRRTEIVRALIEAGADVNVKTIPGTETGCFMRDAFLKGETPLHRAAAYGEIEMVQALLDAGADPSAKDANGDTPISWGSWHLRPYDILGLLLYGDVPGWHGCPNPDGKDLL